MDHLKMHSLNKIDENISKIAKLFPNCVTEAKDENGEITHKIDFDMLKQELSHSLVEGREERYQFTWPDKKQAILTANAPINKTLRPCREESVNFDETENLYIEGDNLEVLKLLQETYLGKIKMIYIDPPYNTGNDFVYNDDFRTKNLEFREKSGNFDEEGKQLVDNYTRNTESNGRFHTDWLNMMYPRLKLARDLLSDDGVIFISIDDNEVENLKKICTEIFSEGNCIGVFSVENNPKGRKNSDFISVSSEYCIVYAKNKECSYFIENVPKKASDMTIDEDGKYVHNSGKRVLVGENSFNKIVTNENSEKNYSVYYNKVTRDIKINKESVNCEPNTVLINKGYLRYRSIYKGKLIENTYTAQKLMELYKDKALSFSEDKIYEKNFNDTIRIKSQLVNKEYEAIVHGVKQSYSMELTTTGAGTLLKELFNTNEPVFPASKNIGFLKLLISLFDSREFYILDFFSGSATTAHAVMQLNAEDSGKRKFIMVQLPEITDEKSEAFKAGYKNICEIGKERIRRAGKQLLKTTIQTGGGMEDSLFENSLTTSAETPLGVSNPCDNKKLDIGFRVLKCDTSNMEDVYYTPDHLDKQDLFKNNIKSDRTGEDLLFQTMLDLGIMLSSKIETKQIDGKNVYYVEDNYLVACFDEDVTEETITKIAKEKPYYFVMRDPINSKDGDSLITNFEQIFTTYSPETVRKVL